MLVSKYMRKHVRLPSHSTKYRIQTYLVDFRQNDNDLIFPTGSTLLRISDQFDGLAHTGGIALGRFAKNIRKILLLTKVGPTDVFAHLVNATIGAPTTCKNGPKEEILRLRSHESIEKY